MEVPPTLLSVPALFPYLVAVPPQPHPIPPPLRRPVRIGYRRDLVQEAGDLSEEEIELDEFVGSACYLIADRVVEYMDQVY